MWATKGMISVASLAFSQNKKRASAYGGCNSIWARGACQSYPLLGDSGA